MCLYIISPSVIGIVVAAVLAVLISAVILWVIRKKRSGEFTGFTTDKHLKISVLKDLQIGTSEMCVLSEQQSTN